MPPHPRRYLISNAASLRPLREMRYGDDEPVVVSICSIAFQHHDFVAQALEGFLDQVAPFRIEIVIYDDFSTDGTREIIAEYAARFPGIIRAILPERNYYSLGINPYYAFVFPAAQGRYIAICDADDYWQDPDKLARQAACLDAEPDVALTYGRALSVDGFRQTGEEALGIIFDLSPLEMKTGVGINTFTACFRNPFLECPPPVLRHSPMGDLSLWSLLGGVGRGKYLADLAPGYYRTHPGGILSQQSEARKYHLALTGFATLAGYQSLVGDDEAERRILFTMLKMAVSRIGRARTLRWLVGDRLAGRRARGRRR